MKRVPPIKRKTEGRVKEILPKRKTPVHMPIAEQRGRTAIIFITVCSKKRKSILPRSDVHDLLMDAWRQGDAWLVGRYVIMPDHIHLFCAPGRLDAPDLKRWIQYWRSMVSRSWPRPDEQPIWQKFFWDTQLRRGENYTSKWEYVRNNPVRAGLCESPEDWPFQGEMNVLPWDD